MFPKEIVVTIIKRQRINAVVTIPNVKVDIVDGMRHDIGIQIGIIGIVVRAATILRRLQEHTAMNNGKPRTEEHKNRRTQERYHDSDGNNWYCCEGDYYFWGAGRAYCNEEW